MRLSLIFTVLLALLVVALPPGIALAQGKAGPVRTLPQVISPGSTIEVRVTFTAPADMFNSIGISDTAPEGWNVTVDASWCDPAPEFAKTSRGNTAQFIWRASFDRGTTFKAVYKVTVPQNASNASVESPAFNGTEGLEYYIGPNLYFEDIVEAGEGGGGGAGGGGPGTGWIIGIVVGIVVIVAVVLLVRRRRKAAVSGG